MKDTFDDVNKSHQSSPLYWFAGCFDMQDLKINFSRKVVLNRSHEFSYSYFPFSDLASKHHLVCTKFFTDTCNILRRFGAAKSYVRSTS